ncbi:tetratricopeptide repeat protein [Pseudoalteromonas luteoviolacea]|uniref:tetratricopeptide repeat protein n=1 Tax=Pseudoalteromonas luteoviolacea TaxID=43657 RepID=UPI001B3A4201|nr:tetratricopeptide repeat protein [Pseudoalteromonas luteoviolacea]MBQ4878676.1 tetratricopeptide repeat protein [Pseudoalteromonas luteoviolacea]MBQ4907216.1 tetratricopeptide repeat protein [Pseudoalteromonas luteoviolacea]
MSELALNKHAAVFCIIVLFFNSFAFATLSNEQLVKNIENSQGTAKIEAIIDYVQTNFHYNTSQALEYADEGLQLLELHPSHDQSARLLNHLSRAYISYGDLNKANTVALQAQQFAQKSTVMANELRVQIVLADIAIRQRKYDLARARLIDVIEQAKQGEFKVHLANAHRISGHLDSKTRDYEAALGSYLQSLSLYRKLNDSVMSASIHQSLASLYRKMNLYEKVLFHQKRAIQISLTLDNPNQQAIFYSNMGTYFDEVGKFEKAIEMHLKSLALKEELGYKLGMIHTYNRLGSVYREAGDFKKSEQMLKEAVALKKEINRPDPNISTYLDLGRLYIETGQLELAERYLIQSISLYQGSPWEDRIAEIHQALAKLHLVRQQPRSAIDAYMRAIEIAQEHQREALLMECQLEVAAIFEQQGMHMQALAYTKDYLTLKNIWEEKNNQYRISALAIEFGVREKEREIASLVQQNRIKDLEIEKQAVQQVVFLIGMLFVFCFLSFSYFWRTKNKQLRVEQAALKQVSEVKERLSHALWGSGDELWDWDLQTGVITRDNQMNKLCLPCEQIGADLKAIKSSVHPDDYERLHSKFNRHLEGDSDFYEVNYRVMTKSGRWLWVSDRGKVTSRAKDGTVLRVSGTIKDISEIKASELALAELNATLEKRVEERTLSLKQSRDELAEILEELTSTQANLVEAQKMASLGRLVAGVSHELNTPLGTTVTASSILLKELYEFKSKLEASKLTLSDTKSFIDVSLSSIELIDSNTERAAQLIKRFKQASAHEYVSSESQIDLKACIEGVIGFHGKDSDVIVEIDCPDNCMVQCDSQALGKIFEDLYLNSLLHGFEGKAGHISIDVTAEQEQVFLRFTDNGRGVEQQAIAHMFEPFYTTARHQGKVGLGLYMVFNLVTYVLRGSIRYCPDQDKGACFEMTFPIVRPSNG